MRITKYCSVVQRAHGGLLDATLLLAWMPRWPAILSVLVLALAAPVPSFGQTIWNNTGTGDWNTPANWSLGAPNSASGTAFDAQIKNGGTAQLLAPGASVRRMRVGVLTGGGHLDVNGGELTVTEDFLLNFQGTSPASVTVQNNGSVTAVDTVVGHSSAANTSFLITGAGTFYNSSTSFIVGQAGTGTASLTIEDGAVLLTGFSRIGLNAGSTGNATVSGPGSQWLTIGSVTVGSSGTGTLTIDNDGFVHVETALSINGTSNVNLNGGTLRFNTLSGITRLNYNSGTIQLAGNRDILFDAGLFDFYGASRVITSGKGLTVEGTTTIRQDKTLTVSGGTFTSQGLLALGMLNSSGGALQINNGGAAAAGADMNIDYFGLANVNGVGASLSIAGSLLLGGVTRGDLIIQNQGNVYIGDTFTIGEFGQFNLNGGSIRFNGYNRFTVFQSVFTAGTIQLAGDRTIGSDAAIQDFFGTAPTIPTGKALVVEGTALLTASASVTLSGGTFSADTVLMTPGSRITNTQSTQVSGTMLALAGSVIDATGANLAMGDATRVNGFYGNGTLQVGQFAVTLADANDAVFDSAALVKLGAGGSPGTLDASNGLTLDFGGNITGFGTVSTLDNPAKPLINNGHITGDSVAQPITLPGYVKGVGTFDNVNFTGTFAPGLSPTILTVGNLGFSPSNTLIMELGGTSPGTGYDQLQSSAALSFDGKLLVSLINGFSPAAGQSFNLFDWISRSGSFDTLQLPTLAGLTWDTSQLYTTGMLGLAAAGLPGDYNQNGVVDAADYTVWRDNLGSGTALPNDDTAGVGPDDYTRWKTNFGQITGSGSSANAAVPEPATMVLLILATTCLCLRRAGAAC